MFTSLLHLCHLHAQSLHSPNSIWWSWIGDDSLRTDAKALNHPVVAHLCFQVSKIPCSCTFVLGAEASSVRMNHFEFLFTNGGMRCDVYQYQAMITYTFVEGELKS
jgi:hypothetical protein